MSELICWEEIKKKYPDANLALNNVVKDDKGNITWANVVYSTYTMSYPELMDRIFTEDLEYESTVDLDSILKSGEVVLVRKGDDE